MELVHRLIDTEPVRLLALVEALLLIVAMFVGDLDPATAGAILAFILATHEFVRSIVTPRGNLPDGNHRA